MKKRFLSLLLALAMCLSLSVPALAAEGDGAPYSLPYLEDIDSLEFLTVLRDGEELDVDLDMPGVTQVTSEIYQYTGPSATWSEMISPIREALRDAGFEETLNVDDNGDDEYYYDR